MESLAEARQQTSAAWLLVPIEERCSPYGWYNGCKKSGPLMPTHFAGRNSKMYLAIGPGNINSVPCV